MKAWEPQTEPNCPWLVSECLLVLATGLVLPSFLSLLGTSEAGSLWPELLAYVLQILCFLLLPLLVVMGKYRLPGAALGWGWPARRQVLTALLWGLGLYLLNLLLTTVVMELLPKDLARPQSVTLLLDQTDGFAQWVLLALLIVFLAPLAEECLFRAFLFPAFCARLGRWLGLLVSAILFAGLHLNLVAFLPLFVGGLGFGLLYERQGSLLCNAIAHTVWNGASLALYVLQMNQ